MKCIIIIILIILSLLAVVEFSCVIVASEADDRLEEWKYKTKKFIHETDKKRLKIREEIENGKQNCNV